MKNFEIVTDACCDLPASYLQANDIEFIPMTVQYNQQEYQDDLGLTFDYSAYVSAVQAGSIATTSQINVGTFMEVFSRFENHPRPVLYVCFSSGLSGSYHSALTALKLLEEEGKNIPVKVVDSKAASLGEGLLVVELLKKRNAGVTFANALTWLEEKKMYVQSWVTVDDLSHLQRGGRLSKTAATVGGFLNVKPIIMVDRSGRLVNVGKVRGRKKSLEKIVHAVIEGIVNPAEQTIFIAFAGDEAAGQEVATLLAKQIKVREIKVMPMGPTIFSHAGFGALAIFSFGSLR